MRWQWFREILTVAEAFQLKTASDSTKSKNKMLASEENKRESFLDALRSSLKTSSQQLNLSP